MVLFSLPVVCTKISLMLQMLMTGTDYDTLIWGPLSLDAGKSVTGKIRNVRITDTVGEYTWDAYLLIPPLASHTY